MSISNDSILIIQTGGTIDKDYPKRSRGYGFEICDAAVSRIVKRASIPHKISFLTICRKDSQDITLENRNHLLSAVLDAKQNKILITHGTDTMIETARHLQPRVTDKVVILTGAFKPETFKDSDADFNVGFGLGALACLSGCGVFVAMNGIIKPPNEIFKDETNGNFYIF